jgi:hypothetical protein
MQFEALSHFFYIDIDHLKLNTPIFVSSSSICLAYFCCCFCALDADVLRMIQTPEDTYVYDRVISTVFNEDRLVAKMQCQHESSKKSICKNDNSELLDSIIEVSKEVFKRHCAKRFQISPLRSLDGKFTENRYV